MSTLDEVGLHLQVYAISLKDNPLACDVFGRSAYNRYYYAMFIVVRSLLQRLDKRWNQTPHADYPKILKGEIRKTISSGRTRALKAGDASLILQCQQATAAAANLAELMKAGSAVRVIADYHPELKIVFVGTNRFELNNINISTAHDWPNRASVFAETIELVWGQINA